VTTPQLSLGYRTPPPYGHWITGIDPAKDKLFCATYKAPPAHVPADNIADLLLAYTELHVIHWANPVGWQQACQLLARPGPVAHRPGTGYVLCEAQWAGDDAKDKWSGLEGLCQTSGALRAASAAVGLPCASVIHWSREKIGRSAPREVARVDMSTSPFTYTTTGLGFAEPNAWRGIALTPRPTAPRALVRKVEQRCAGDFFGRAIGADFSAAFGIMLAAMHLNYTDLGVAV
jgi:hypothetical protein